MILILSRLKSCFRSNIFDNSEFHPLKCPNYKMCCNIAPKWIYDRHAGTDLTFCVFWNSTKYGNVHTIG